MKGPEQSFDETGGKITERINPVTEKAEGFAKDLSLWIRSYAKTPELHTGESWGSHVNNALSTIYASVHVARRKGFVWSEAEEAMFEHRWQKIDSLVKKVWNEHKGTYKDEAPSEEIQEELAGMLDALFD